VNDTAAFLLHYRYAVLFGAVLAEQAGLPVPAVPFLLAAGALAATGGLDPALALGLAVLGSLLADLAWYEAGRRRGGKVLNLLCRISLEPDSCVRRTEDVFARHGARTLLVAKFLPGLSTVGPPLAGVIGMRLLRFLLHSGAGALLWAGAYGLVGFLFHDQLEAVAERALALGGRAALVLGATFALWLGAKYVERRRFLRSLRIARISVEELKRKMEAGEELVIVDLRGSLDFEADPRRIPGALRLATGEIEARHQEIPRDRDVVLYCT
jgi:membrane protein DedA with SNARE-associated domain